MAHNSASTLSTGPIHQLNPTTQAPWWSRIKPPPTAYLGFVLAALSVKSIDGYESYILLFVQCWFIYIKFADNDKIELRSLQILAYHNNSAPQGGA